MKSRRQKNLAPENLARNRARYSILHFGAELVQIESLSEKSLSLYILTGQIFVISEHSNISS